MRSRIVAFLCLCAAILTALATPSSAAAPTRAVSVGGDVAHPLSITADKLVRRYRAHTQFDTFTTATGRQFHVFRGALLRDVLADAKPVFDPQVHNDELRVVVKASGTDGYTAVMSYAELDPHFAGTSILLADRQDGRPLVRPRLVVPSDAAGGRYVSELTTLTVEHVQ